VKLTLVRSAEKELEKLREPTLSKVLNKLDAIEATPLPSGNKKLKGFPDLRP